MARKFWNGRLGGPVLAALALVLAAAPAWAGMPFRTRDGAQIRWRTDRLVMHVSREVHLGEGSRSGVDRRDRAESVHAAVWGAVQAWSASGVLPFEIELRLADEQRVGSVPNLVTFTDPAPFDRGTCPRESFIACAMVSFVPESGELLGVNIAFNPYKRHSATGLEGTHDIGLVMMHEMGHALGLGHSPVASAVMSANVEVDPGAGGQIFAQQALGADDVLTLASVYGTGALALVEGTLRVDGAAARNGQVTALDERGEVVTGAVTEADGSYRLWLKAGKYRLMAGPRFDLEAPVAPVFAARAWPATGGGGEGEVIELAEGEERRGMDFDLASGGVRIESIGLIQNNYYLGSGRVFVGRGNRVLLAMTRTPAPGAGEVRFSHPGLKPDGALMQFQPEILVGQWVQIAEDAPLGCYAVEYHTGEATSFLAGGICVTARGAAGEAVAGAARVAKVELRRMEGERARVVIRGTDLAGESKQASFWDQAPVWPVQLGRVSVRIGDRYAPLVSVAPEEIVAELPEGLEANGTRLWVVTGMTESPGVELRVGS